MKTFLLFILILALSRGLNFRLLQETEEQQTTDNSGAGGDSSAAQQQDQTQQQGDQTQQQGDTSQSQQSGGGQSGGKNCKVGDTKSIVATCYKGADGDLTASGQPLNQNADTFSELSSGTDANGNPDYAGLGGLPFGAQVKVKGQNGQEIVVTKNDKGGATKQAMDIHEGAMGRLGLPCDGNHNVDVEVVGCPS